jgi:hypothetical protein
MHFAMGALMVSNWRMFPSTYETLNTPLVVYLFPASIITIGILIFCFRDCGCCVPKRSSILASTYPKYRD